MVDVLVAALSHSPGLTAFPERAAPASSRAVFGAVDDLRTRLAEFRPDVVIGISNDHFTSTSTACLPPFGVATAAGFQNPADDRLAEFLAVARRTTPGHPALAHTILEHLLAAGVDTASLGGRFGFDENFAVPLHLLGLGDVPIVPVIVNAVAAPMPPLGRCLALGRALRDALAGQSHAARVAVLGTGGLSHSVGTPAAGRIDSELDRRLLDDFDHGRLAALAQLDPRILALAGNGTEEIRQWLAAAAVAAPAPLQTLAYEPVPAFLTGVAVACAAPVEL